jgi:hypothetical protein
MKSLVVCVLALAALLGVLESAPPASLLIGDRGIVHPTGLLYSTFMGGGNDDQAYGIAIDASGAIYIAGVTNSPNFPTTPGAFQPTCGGCPFYNDAFVAKFDASGALVYATYLGGGDNDWGYDLALDATGAAYVTGYTYSTDFPTTPGAFQTTLGGFQNPFVAKLNPTGSGLVYSTYLGGDWHDYAVSIAVDASGAAYITGMTQSGNFPTTPGAFQPAFGGITDAFLAKLNASGSALVYSTYLGGTDSDLGWDVALDVSGAAHVTGRTISPDFPITPGAFQPTCASCPTQEDAFALKLDPSGGALVYATFLGGSGADCLYGCALTLDSGGAATLTGATTSADFPTTPGVYQPTCRSCPAHSDIYITTINATGSSLIYSTFLGGNDRDNARSIALDASDAAVLAGHTRSPDFPITPGAYQPTCHSCPATADALLTKLNATGSALVYSTFLGGGDDDNGHGLRLDASGIAYVTGRTASADLPTTAGAFDPSYNGGPYDAFAAKLDLLANPPTPTPTPTGSPTPTSTPMSYELYLPLVLRSASK